MKPLTVLTKEEVDKIKLLCFDCDGVTVPEGTKISEKEGKLLVETTMIKNRLVEKLERLKKRFWLSFSSGRSLLYLTRMYEPLLYERVILQGENGLFALKEGEVFQLELLSNEQLEILRKVKNEIREWGKTNPDVLGFEPKQFLVTVHCRKPLEEIPEIVRRRGEGRLYSLWSGEAYDINFKFFNKGRGLERLAKRLGLERGEVMAIGNDPNDKEMVEWAGIGITSNRESMSAADYYTLEKQESGGEELIDRLLALV